MTIMKGIKEPVIIIHVAMFVHVRCTTMHDGGKGVIFNSKSMPTPLYAHHVCLRRGKFMSFAYTNNTTPKRVVPFEQSISKLCMLIQTLV